METPASAPGGLYVGYYLEDPSTNPEDPEPGAFVLNLPSTDSAFNGSMYFTYVGCQTSNVGNVSGTKSGNTLSGTWSGTVDGSAESGPYSGTYDPITGYYHGVYSNSGGKQFKSIAGCIEYYIAPNGTWEMFPVEQNLPSTFNVAVAGSSVSWNAPAGAAYSLVYVLDPSLVQSGVNPVKWQAVLPGSMTTANLGSIGLVSGKEYIAVTLVVNSNFARIAFGSKKFIAS